MYCILYIIHDILQLLPLRSWGGVLERGYRYRYRSRYVEVDVDTDMDVGLLPLL